MNIEPKQVIVMRKDLNMRKGKMVAQGSHASMAAILNHMEKDVSEGGIDYTLSTFNGTAVHQWLKERFKKVCVSVDSEQELVDIYNKAKEAGLLCALITDSGLTEFNGVPTKTCCAIGPAWPDQIDQFTGHLKLL